MVLKHICTDLRLLGGTTEPGKPMICKDDNDPNNVCIELLLDGKTDFCLVSNTTEALCLSFVGSAIRRLL